jgi:hypothetical protein
MDVALLPFLASFAATFASFAACFASAAACFASAAAFFLACEHPHACARVSRSVQGRNVEQWEAECVSVRCLDGVRRSYVGTSNINSVHALEIWGRACRLHGDHTEGQQCSAVDAVQHLFLCFLLRLGLCLGLVRRLFGFEFQSLGLFLLLLGRHRGVRIARLTRPLIASLQLGSCCSKVETQQESRARVAAACGLTQPFLSPRRARKIFCAYSNRRFDASEHLWAVVQALGVGGGAHPRAEKTSQSSQVLRSCRSKRGPKNNLL